MREETRQGTRIGVMALQGAFAEHCANLRRLGVRSAEVRLPGDLEELDGLIIPGGESTTISRLMVAYGLLEPVRELAARGLPVMGTCAGMILLANRAIGLTTPTLGLMDIEVERNAFGRQVDSFETPVAIPALGSDPFPAVFIRAPLLRSSGPGVDILACLPDGTAVVARQGRLLVAAFHPELTTDTRFHAYFVEGLCTREGNPVLGGGEGTPSGCPSRGGRQ
ncbi:MAG: pyridoxal 5'-phosphate synthase glutaminase subunit PdxT [Chloroflexota bacterium]